MTATAFAPSLARTGSTRAPAHHDIASVEQFRGAFRRLAGGVSVITVGEPGERTGFTATSVTSFSSEPPTLVFSVAESGSSYLPIQRLRTVGVNFLAAHQQPVADRFSGRGGIAGEARFADATWVSAKNGASLLADARAALGCDVEEIILRHGQALVIARIVDVRLGELADPLTYWNGRYGSFDGQPKLAPDGLAAY